MERVMIIPFGKIDRDALDAIAAGLRDAFGCDAVIGAPVPVPERALHPARQQYRSTEILRMLGRSTAEGRDRTLGVIDHDLYVPELNFVFGEVDMVAGTAVISLVRLRQEHYSLPPDRPLFLLRAVKEAIHEIGHSVGLSHCPDPSCIMHFSNSLADTDRKGPGFCSRHRQQRGRT